MVYHKQTGKYDTGGDIAWCPGCGNFPILNAVHQVLGDLNLDPLHTVFVSGIGQAAKTPQYIKTHYFNGLHGRALPPATAIKASNPGLTVIVESGDGDIYGEGGNHFIHAIRRNPNITVIVHNNMVYGLTLGQASPTALKGFKTPIQVDGVSNEPFNPLSVAIALDCSFVARANSADIVKTKEIIKAAIAHRGFSLVDIFQPCIVFNKLNSVAWFREHTYYLDEQHNSADRSAAFAKATEADKLGLGIFYKKDKPTFEDSLAAYATDKRPLFQRTVDLKLVLDKINSIGKE